MLTDRFTCTVDCTRIAHAAQLRKTSNIPNLSHLLGISRMVIEFGVNVDLAIADLLHDVSVDCGG